MRPGRSRNTHVAKVPLVFTALAISGVFGSTCVEESCDASLDKPSEGAALLQHRHHRSHVHKYAVAEAQPDAAPSAEIFQDVPGEGCRVGSSCAAGGIPESRGACVQASSTDGSLNIECWDICNAAHEPEDYTTGSPDRDAKLAQAVLGVRAGEYPHMSCPTSSSLDGQESPVPDAPQNQEILTVMEGVKEAEQAAERARLLTAAAERESAALGEDFEGSKEAAEVMKLAAAAEAEAAQKARRASKDLKRLSKKRAAEATAAEAEYEQEQEGAQGDAEGAQEDVTAPVAGPTDIVVAPLDHELPYQGIEPTFDEATALEDNDSASNATSSDEPLLGSGCCFSFGYAAMLEPCCLSAGQVTNRSLCEGQANLTGGQTSFTYGRCPTTALEAEAFIMGTEVSEAAHSVELTTADSSDPTADDSIELRKKIEAVDASFEKAKTDAVSKNTIALTKLSTEKNMEALAIAANRDARSAAAEVDIRPEQGERALAPRDPEADLETLALKAELKAKQDPEKSEQAPETRKPRADLETLALKAELEAKIAATEARQALSNASDADLTVKRHVQWQRLVDAQIAAKKVADIKKELSHFEAALEQLRGLGNITNVTDGTERNLEAALAVRRLTLKEAQEQEKTAKKAVQIAQEEAAAAALAAEEARNLVEKAQIEEEQARNAQGGKASNDDKDKTAGCQWTPAAQCVQEFQYKGKTVLGCTDKDRYVPWCSHDANFTAGSENWSTCTYSCADDSANKSTEDGSGEDPDNIIRPGSRGNLTRWGHGIPQTAKDKEATTRRCGWKPESGCVPSFTYKDVMYTGCTDVAGEAVGWCSLDTVYVGRWEKCDYLCEGDQTSADWTEQPPVEEETSAEGENPSVKGGSGSADGEHTSA